MKKTNERLLPARGCAWAAVIASVAAACSDGGGSSSTPLEIKTVNNRARHGERR